MRMSRVLCRGHVIHTTTRLIIRPSAGACLNAVDLYDSVTGKWSTARLSVARSRLAATSVGNMALFAGGGLHLPNEVPWRGWVCKNCCVLMVHVALVQYECLRAVSERHRVLELQVRVLLRLTRARIRLRYRRCLSRCSTSSTREPSPPRPSSPRHSTRCSSSSFSSSLPPPATPICLTRSHLQTLPPPSNGFKAFVHQLLQQPMCARSNLLASKHRHRRASVCTAPLRTSSWAMTHAPPTRHAHKSRQTLTVLSSTQCSTASAHTLPSSNPCSSPSRTSASFRPPPPLPSSTLSPKPPKPLASQSLCTAPSFSLSQRVQGRFLCSPPRPSTTRCCARCK